MATSRPPGQDPYALEHFPASAGPQAALAAVPQPVHQVDVADPSDPPRPGWFVASATGGNHLAQGLPNQDRGLGRELASGALVFSVADGAGSRPRSACGAQFAVEACVRAADEVFGAGLLGNEYHVWLDAARVFARRCLHGYDEEVYHHARVVPVSDRPGVLPDWAYGCTLLSVVAAPPWFAVVSIGDGFLVVNRDSEGPRLLLPPPMDREHSGITHFLSSSDREKHLVVLALRDPQVSGVALCTDGLAEGVLRFAPGAGGPLPYVPPEFGEYFRFVASTEGSQDGLTSKLAGPDFAVTSGDDKTMVIAAWR